MQAPADTPKQQAKRRARAEARRAALAALEARCYGLQWAPSLTPADEDFVHGLPGAVCDLMEELRDRESLIGALMRFFRSPA